MCFSEIMKKFRTNRQIESIKKMNALYGTYMTEEEIKAKAEKNAEIEERMADARKLEEEKNALKIARAALNPVEFEHIETNALSFNPHTSEPRTVTRTNYTKTITRAPHICKYKISKNLKNAMFKYLVEGRGRAEGTAESACVMLNAVNFYLEKYEYAISNIEDAKTVEDIVGIKAFLETIEEFQREQKIYKTKAMKSLDYYTDVAILAH